MLVSQVTLTSASDAGSLCRCQVRIAYLGSCGAHTDWFWRVQDAPAATEEGSNKLRSSVHSGLLKLPQSCWSLHRVSDEQVLIKKVLVCLIKTHLYAQMLHPGGGELRAPEPPADLVAQLTAMGFEEPVVRKVRAECRVACSRGLPPFQCAMEFCCPRGISATSLYYLTLPHSII
jgi:hypothetical protein